MKSSEKAQESPLAALLDRLRDCEAEADRLRDRLALLEADALADCERDAADADREDERARDADPDRDAEPARDADLAREAEADRDL